MSQNARLALVILILSATGVVAEKNPASLATSSASSSDFGVDEQLILSFTQNFASVAFNVTAIEQCGIDNTGPAYLVNGRSNTGYWYQVGLAWNWVSAHQNTVAKYGFGAIFEVFSSNGTEFHIGGAGPILDPLGQIHEKDLVLLKLSFTKSDTVLMYVHDWNSGATGQTSYSAFGATSFVGSPNAPSDSNGFFTGLMTEQYRSSPYYGDEQTVTYKESGLELSSAWMQIDEYSYPSKSPVLFNQATYVGYGGSSQLQNFTSNGAFEASNSDEFLTGRQSTGPTCAPFLYDYDYSRLILPSILGVLVVVLGLVLVWQRKRSINRTLPESSFPTSKTRH